MMARNPKRTGNDHTPRKGLLGPHQPDVSCPQRIGSHILFKVKPQEMPRA